MPVLLCWHDTIAEVKLHPDIPLLKTQKQAMLELLASMNAEYRDDSFWIPQHIASNYFVVAMTDDPEQVLEWKPILKNIPEKKQDYSNPFISDYTKSGYAIIRDDLLAEMIWQSFMKFMLHRLLNEQKPVDLYFARIVPLQMRIDWKSIATAWEAKHVKNGLYDPNLQSLVDRGVADFLIADTITGSHKGPSQFKNTNTGCCTGHPPVVANTANWTLEIITNEDFMKTARNVELHRRWLQHKGYWRAVNTQLKKQLPNALEVYSDYLEKAALPYAVLYRSIYNIVPGVKHRKDRPLGERLESDIGRKRSAALKPPAVNERLETPLAGADASVSSMPVVQ